MGGKTSTSTSQVSVPPEVLAQYQSVNAAAQNTAQTPFQQYSTDPNAFVAPVNSTEQAGISGVSGAANEAQPYYDAATGTLGAAQDAGTGYYDASGLQVGAAQATGDTYGSAATSALGSGVAAATPLQSQAGTDYTGAYAAAQPYNAAAGTDYTGAYANAQPYNSGALASYTTALGAAQPYNAAATQNISGAQDIGTALTGASLGTLGAASAQATPTQQAALGTAAQSYLGAQPYIGAALGTVDNAQATASPLNAQALAGAGGAESAALGDAGGAAGAAAGGAGSVGQAAGLYNQGLSFASPLNTQAASGLTTALQGAQPYQNAATTLATAGGQAVDPNALNIGAYLSPYLQTVLGSTSSLLNQNNQQQMSGELGNIINSGAFGGDRAGIAAANLEQQQNLANANIYSGIANTGFNTALGAAQQQQGVQLGASQANRAALQEAASQLQGIGQQGYEQGTGTAQALAGLGSTGFNEYGTAGQGLGSLGVQQAGVGVQAAGVGVQAAGVANQAAQTQAQVANQIYGQGLSTAQEQAALGSQAFGQGQTTAQNVSGIGSTLYNQGLSTAQQQQAAGTALSGLGLTAAQQQAALGSQVFGQGSTTGSALQGLGSQVFGQGSTTGSALQGLGSTINSQGTALGSAQQGLAQQVYGQGLSTSGQLGTLGQQLFGQGMTAAQQQAALGQDVYGMGANTATTLGALGSGAQTAGIQGGQAQLAAGQVPQQTQQAGLTALYNQYLQQQSYPFQVDQFLANIAEGTGSLSGSTTTTTQPGGLFSDERLKTDIVPVGKTFDGQDIVRFRYKNDPAKLTRIGLIAQDVAKRHPDAVGLAGGFHTVDYGKATDKAARLGLGAAANDHHANDDDEYRPEEPRKMYAVGGMPILPGEYPADMQAILQAQSQMYGPYGAGLYGAQAGSAPRGGSSYVPAANLPVSHLAVANAPPQPVSPMEHALAVANLASKGEDLWNSGSGLTKKLLSGMGGQGGGVDDGPDAERNGGRVGYADGGLPYDAGETGLDIPDEPNKYDLVTAQNPTGHSGSALGNAASLVGDGAKLAGAIPGVGAALGSVAGAAGSAASGIGSTIASLLPFLALKNGGRAGYADGGDPTLSEAAAIDDPADMNLGQFVPQGPDPNMLPGTNIPRPSSVLDNDDVVPLTTPTKHSGNSARKALGSAHRASTPVPAADDPWANGPQIGQDSTPSGLGAVAAPPPVSINPDFMPTAAPQVTSPAQLTPPSAPSLNMAPAGQSAPATPPQSGPGLGAGLGQDVGNALSGTGDFFKQHPGLLPSILTGIAAAGTAPTQHLGTALMAGLGAGSQAYMTNQQKLAQIAQEKAGAQAQQAQATASQAQAGFTQANTLKTLGDMYPGFFAQEDPNGALTFQGKRYTLIPIARAISKAPINTGAPPAAPSANAPAGQGAAQGAAPNGPFHTDYKSGTVSVAPSAVTHTYLSQQFGKYGYDPSGDPITNVSLLKNTDPAFEDTEKTEAAQAAARIGDQQDVEGNHRQIVQLATAINALPDTGLAAVGPGFSARQNVLSILQTGERMLGLQPSPDENANMSNAQLIDKIRHLQGAALAHSDNLRAAQIANALTAVLPGGTQSKDAANDIMSTMLVQNQNTRDFAKFRQSYAAENGFQTGVQQAFDAETRPYYDREQPEIAAMFKKGANGYSPAGALQKAPTAANIQRFEAVFGPGSSRYVR